MRDLSIIAEQFMKGGSIADIRQFGKGNINETFLVTLDYTSDTCFMLQRLNRKVFQQPELVMRNMRLVIEHIHHRLEQSPLRSGRRWVMPSLLATRNGQDYSFDEDGSLWRAMSVVERSQSFERIRDSDHAREVGYAVGMFHTLVSDFSSDRLAETLPGFHVTPIYLQHYDAVTETAHLPKSPEVNYCLKFVRERRRGAQVLEEAKRDGRLRIRTVHGDPKVNNIMIDSATGQAVSIVDLDTVMPGLIQYDIGDCLRSGCNPLGEEPARWEDVRFETDLCNHVLRGYSAEARGVLTAEDFAFLYDSVRLIAFELGLRFFTDYLEGNVYFKIRYPEQNLSRALAQFRIAESIEAAEKTIRNIVRDLK